MPCVFCEAGIECFMLFRGTTGLKCFRAHSAVSASFQGILFSRICSCSYSGKKKKTEWRWVAMLLFLRLRNWNAEGRILNVERNAIGLMNNFHIYFTASYPLHRLNEHEWRRLCPATGNESKASMIITLIALKYFRWAQCDVVAGFALKHAGRKMAQSTQQ